ADGVVLHQGENQEDVTLTARDGRLATDDDGLHTVRNVAVCDVITVVQKLVQRPSAREELDDFIEKSNAKLQGMKEDLQQLQKALEQESDPAARARIAQEGQARLQEFQQEQRKVLEQQDQLQSKMMVQAYGLARNAIDAVCKDLDIDIVLATRDPELELETGITTKVLTDILSRTVVHYPTEIDITAEVLDELNL
ncbi:MAG TPA: OmpH family outer membrane protein, partial [Phycisphaeraceae bacterium]|nr:OmpH family outer membrane protein [Phycisphaeraceae bacterium]